MFDFGKSLINMNPDEQKKMLDNATSGQRNMALEMGIGFNKPKPRQQPKQQKRGAYHDLDRLNTIVEKKTRQTAWSTLRNAAQDQEWLPETGASIRAGLAQRTVSKHTRQWPTYRQRCS
jgi:hypothetical protein